MEQWQTDVSMERKVSKNTMKSCDPNTKPSNGLCNMYNREKKAPCGCPAVGLAYAGDLGARVCANCRSQLSKAWEFGPFQGYDKNGKKID